MRAREQMRGNDIDAHMCVADIGETEPERENRRMKVPFQFADASGAEAGHLVAHFAGHHVKAGERGKHEKKAAYDKGRSSRQYVRSLCSPQAAFA